MAELGIHLSDEGRRAVRNVIISNEPEDALVQGLGQMATDLAKHINLKLIQPHKCVPFVFGTGGDFEEFAVPFISTLERNHGYDVGCLWPYQSQTVEESDERIVYFDQEYCEKSDRRSNVLIVVQSVISSLSPIEAVIERAIELKPNLALIVVSAVCDIEVERTLRAKFGESLAMLSATYLDLRKGSFAKLSYWALADKFDQREMKIVPKVAEQILERLDATPEQRLLYDWPVADEYGFKF